MASTLADFTLSAVAAPDDFIVGYDEAALNGERRWTVSTIANAVSGVASLGTVKSVTGTAPISVANGTTTPAISIATATTTGVGVAELATLAEVQGGIGTNTIVTPANLNTLLNTLSTNIMNTVGNYPYLEYAWVTAPNTAAQTFTSNVSSVMTLNTEVADSGNYGSLTSNQITLSAGTYQYDVETNLAFTGGAASGPAAILGIWNRTASNWISRRGRSLYNGNDGPIFGIRGQFTIDVNSVIELRLLTNRNLQVESAGYSASFTNSTANADQRTTIKLWKVG